MKFNKQQQEAIDFFEGACAVIAQAGAGKSTVLTNRIKNLVYEHDVKQENILSISFTRNTADELKKKLKKIGCSSVNVGTFHSVCARILAIEGIDVSKRIQDWEVENIFKSIDKEADAKDIQSFIGYQKNYMKNYNDEFVKKESEYSEEELRVFFKAYEDYKADKHLYDYEDWLIKCYQLLQENPNSHTFDFVLVDEHQDSNLVQNLLIKELCPKGNVFCVFDYRQCFPKGTQIRTGDGLKNIEDIKLQMNKELLYEMLKDLEDIKLVRAVNKISTLNK
jgi:DNA helicase-2/ATP-dependent DNA helicase PcrA